MMIINGVMMIKGNIKFEIIILYISESASVPCSSLFDELASVDPARISCQDSAVNSLFFLWQMIKMAANCLMYKKI